MQNFGALMAEQGSLTTGLEPAQRLAFYDKTGWL
jgi:hypothetical protein